MSLMQVYYAGVLARVHKTYKVTVKAWQKVKEEEKVLCLLMMPEIQTDLPEG